MIELYHCAGARSFRPLWALEEMQLPYTLHTLRFPPRFTVPDYLQNNPLGTIPALRDGDVFMTESAAIVHYLVTRYGPTPLAVAPDEPGYGAYLNFLVMAEATLTFPQTIYLRYAVFEPEEKRNPQAAADYTRWFANRAAAAATLLGPHYACAGRFTAADISLGYTVKLALAIGLKDALPPRLIAYWEQMQDRPGLQRATARES